MRKLNIMSDVVGTRLAVSLHTAHPFRHDTSCPYDMIKKEYGNTAIVVFPFMLKRVDKKIMKGAFL